MGKSSKWDTVEGGSLPGSDGPIKVTVTGASFNYDAAYNNGDTLVFILEGDCDHELWQDTIIYSIGASWDTEDNNIVTSDTLEGFRQGTNYARFFRAVLDTEAADIVMERGDASDEGPADASIYEGLIFEFERQQYTSTFDGETTERYILLPTKFLGEVGKKKKKGGKGKSDSAKVTAKTLRPKIKKLSKKFDDHDDFVEAVLDKFPEVEDMEDLYDDVLDEDNWDF